MILKIFGAGDIICAIVALLLHFETGHWRITFAASAYLLIKGACYYKDTQSWADMAIAIYLWPVFFGFTTIIDYLIVLYLLQKGALSMSR